jgi:oxygen-independent coproporphyrinogen-3 oxidase
MNYWDLGEYVGLGAGASSYFDGMRYTNVKSIEEYMRRIRSGNEDPADFSEKCDEETKRKEYIMLKLRTKNGINTAEFTGRFGFDFENKYSNIIRKQGQAGYGVLDKDGYRLTLRGFLVSNKLISEFF